MKENMLDFRNRACYLKQLLSRLYVYHLLLELKSLNLNNNTKEVVHS